MDSSAFHTFNYAPLLSPFSPEHLCGADIAGILCFHKGCLEDNDLTKIGVFGRLLPRLEYLFVSFCDTWTTKPFYMRNGSEERRKGSCPSSC